MSTNNTLLVVLWKLASWILMPCFCSKQTSILFPITLSVLEASMMEKFIWLCTLLRLVCHHTQLCQSHQFAKWSFVLMGGWSKLVDQKSEFRVASAMVHNMTLWTQSFCWGTSNYGTSWLGWWSTQPPINCCPKTSQICVAGFPVMVLFLWSSTCDKHNKHNLVIFKCGETSVQKCLLSIFVEQTP